jgi:LL-diaminopimelate aminotransferase
MSANRTLAAIPPYVFWDLDARRRALRAQGRTLIDVGIGSPDGPIPPLVVEAMQRAAADRGLAGYPVFRGSPRYMEAVAAYMATRFGVTLDPTREVMAVAGSKEGIAELVLAHCNPGDVVLVPAVHYPVYARATQLAGAEPVFVPFVADGSGRLDLGAVAPADLARARMLIVNYPGNPTTATATLEELGALVEFARRHDLLLLSDLAYSELGFDGHRVPSVLQVPGAAEVAVEFHTCSKSFSMAGVRIAFVCGNADALEVLDQYRSNIGYGVSTLAQEAGATAFEHAAELVPPLVAKYRERRDALVAALQANGWPATAPRATMYLWLDVPAGYDDWGWVDALMQGPGVVVTPGIAFGAAGSGKFRVSLVQPADRLVEAAGHLAALAAAAAGRETAPARA